MTNPEPKSLEELKAELDAAEAAEVDALEAVYDARDAFLKALKSQENSNDLQDYRRTQS